MTALQPFGPGIWTAEGPVVSFLGFAYPTRMAAIRLANRDLFVWSPIRLTPALKAEVDTLGRVAHLLSPNKLHHLYLGEWKTAYPDARLYAPPGLARKCRNLHFDAALGDAPEPAWAADIDQARMGGSFAMTEIVFFHRESRTAIFADLVQNFPPGWFKGWRGLVARLDGITASDPGAPREWRFSFRNRKSARQALARILGWRPEQVVIAHGDMVREDGTAFIRKAFRWLAH
ncbi:MAG TPA: DUF4336 domain-containing protein [Rhizomicrobium sp.]|jgi:hypothetical protein|nr:DUF4336 domain-containing protein [Rhizomicrobium sp.]